MKLTLVAVSLTFAALLVYAAMEMAEAIARLRQQQIETVSINL